MLRAISTSHRGHFSHRQGARPLYLVINVIFGASTAVIGTFAVRNIGALFGRIGRTSWQTGLNIGIVIITRRTGTILIVTDSSGILSATSVGARRKAHRIIGVIIVSSGAGAINTIGTFAVLQKCAS